MSVRYALDKDIKFLKFNDAQVKKFISKILPFQIRDMKNERKYLRSLKLLLKLFID
jgi:hypothetical protein